MAKARNDDDLFLDDLGDDLLDDDQPAPAADEGKGRDDFFEDTDVPGQIAVDVYQTKTDVVVVCPVPGVNKNDVEVSLVENTLTIRGRRQASETIQESDYFAQELHWGEISRSIVLPTQVKEEGAEAVLKDGILSVRIPKAEQDKVKKIEIR